MLNGAVDGEIKRKVARNYISLHAISNKPGDRFNAKAQRHEDAKRVIPNVFQKLDLG
jgi:hypothetical protein